MEALIEANKLVKFYVFAEVLIHNHFSILFLGRDSLLS
jgi:hypothetical protein